MSRAVVYNMMVWNYHLRKSKEEQFYSVWKYDFRQKKKKPIKHWSLFIHYTNNYWVPNIIINTVLDSEVAGLKKNQPVIYGSFLAARLLNSCCWLSPFYPISKSCSLALWEEAELPNWTWCQNWCCQYGSPVVPGQCCYMG